MKYPNIIFFRYEKYNYIDHFCDINKDNLNCNINITSCKLSLNKLFDSNYHLLITFGEIENEYHEDVFSIIPSRICKRWIHYNHINDINVFKNPRNIQNTPKIIELLNWPK